MSQSNSIGLDEIMTKVLANPPREGEDERAYNKRMASLNVNGVEKEKVAYITIWADEDGEMWATSYDGHESEHFGTANVPLDEQENNTYNMVTQMWRKINDA